ncbi:probable cytochrome P450 309a2 isoform X2 [Teleopsis dalmanni]|uniref:probable cytochrome P450 309a2 isoform X2 n=1 Tax=Teleopsis dalmanni TaxID=139649 RepID=UPI0018CE833E|nr:probable cytochrome P450 309a2 isoform X2 [Teleopsis dalmanni]
MFVELIFYSLLAVATSLGSLYIYLTWNFKYWQKSSLRIAKPLTFLGTYPSIMTRKRNMVYDIHDVYLNYKSNNRAVGVFVTRKPEILILDPNLAHEILVKNFRLYRDTLTSSWLKQSYTIWQSSCKKLLKVMEDKVGNSGTNIIETRDLCFRFTADVMCNYIWGIDVGTLTNPTEVSHVVGMTDKWIMYTYKTRVYSLMATVTPVVRVIWPFTLFPKETDDFFSKLTRDAVQIRQQQPANTERPDFLNYMLQLQERKGISHDDMVGHSLTMLLDGYETVAIALMHTLYYLAKYPKVQQKLRDELMTNMYNTKVGFSYEELMNLPYLDQCVHETLRLVTLLPNIPRICTEDTTLQLSPEQSVDIPKGMVVTVPVYSLHHDKDYFPQPNEYVPERFDNGAHLELTKRGIYLPFSDGPRICIGARLALMTAKIALAEIILQYEINSCALTQEDQSTNVKSFILCLDGDIMLEYKSLTKYQGFLK